MRTYEFEEEVRDIMNMNPSQTGYNELLTKVLQDAVSLKVVHEATLDAISQVVTEEQAHQVADIMNQKVDEYNWRYIDADAKKVLDDYGCHKPIVVVTEEEAADYLDQGVGVYLLNKDNTETYSDNEKEIKSFLLQGGLIAVPQYYIDEDLEDIVKDHNGTDRDV